MSTLPFRRCTPGNNSRTGQVLHGVPADTHLAGLGSERDFQTVPPANGPKLIESFGPFSCQKMKALLAVHAHPDDETITMGGTLARYSAEGVRTIVVTCTRATWARSATPACTSRTASARCGSRARSRRAMPGGESVGQSGLLRLRHGWLARKSSAWRLLRRGPGRGGRSPGRDHSPGAAPGAGHLRRDGRLRPPRPPQGPRR